MDSKIILHTQIHARQRAEDYTSTVASTVTIRPVMLETRPAPLGIGTIAPEQSTLTEPWETSSVLQSAALIPVALATTTPEQLASFWS